jgi:hypothetical protein
LPMWVFGQRTCPARRPTLPSLIVTGIIGERVVNLLVLRRGFAVNAFGVDAQQHRDTVPSALRDVGTVHPCGQQQRDVGVPKVVGALGELRLGLLPQRFGPSILPDPAVGRFAQDASASAPTSARPATMWPPTGSKTCSSTGNSPALPTADPCERKSQPGNSRARRRCSPPVGCRASKARAAEVLASQAYLRRPRPSHDCLSAS